MHTEPSPKELGGHVGCSAGGMGGIKDDYIEKLYQSMPNQVAMLIEAKGCHTKY